MELVESIGGMLSGSSSLLILEALMHLFQAARPLKSTRLGRSIENIGTGVLRAHELHFLSLLSELVTIAAFLSD